MDWLDEDITRYAPVVGDARAPARTNATISRLRQLLAVRGIGRGRDYALTFCIEFSSLAASLLVLRLAAVYWGPAGFGEYVLGRRTIGMVALPTLFGMALAVTRYMAAARSRAARNTERLYLVVGVSIVITTCILTLSIFNVFARPLSVALFSGERYTPLVRAVALAVVGNALHGLAYGAYRGRLAMGRANAVQFLNLAVVPLSCFLVPHQSPTDFIFLLGAIWSAVALIALADAIRCTETARLSRRGVYDAARELLRYGGPRVPGEFALGALFALPVTFAAHLGGIVVAGHVGLAISVLSMAGSVFSPLGQILLPAISGVSTSQRLLRLRVSLRRLLTLCLCLTILFVGAVEVLAGPLLHVLVGPRFESAIPTLRIIVFAAPAYVTYIILRNVLDALHVRPLNTKNLAIALALFVTACVAARTPAGVPWAVLAAIMVLGGMSAWDAHLSLAGNRAPSRVPPRGNSE